MNNLLNYINKFDNNEYKENILDSYFKFINYTELPYCDRMCELDCDVVPKKYNKILKNISSAINNHISFIVKVPDYVVASKFTNILLERYFIDSIDNDSRVHDVIYVDTNLLLDDYKKCMNFYTNNSNELCLSHSLDLLNNKIYTCDYVIWNRFLMLSSNYDSGKIYNLLLERHRKGLAGLYFINEPENILYERYSEETCNLMNFTHIQDCTLDPIHFKKGETELKW